MFKLLKLQKGAGHTESRFHLTQRLLRSFYSVTEIYNKHSV